MNKTLTIESMAKTLEYTLRILVTLPSVAIVSVFLYRLSSYGMNVSSPPIGFACLAMAGLTLHAAIIRLKEDTRSGYVISWASLILTLSMSVYVTATYLLTGGTGAGL